MKAFWWYWIAWMLAFAGPECYAIATNTKNTLSDMMWHAEGQGATALRFFCACFLIWLFLHIIFGWFR